MVKALPTTPIVLAANPTDQAVLHHHAAAALHAVDALAVAIVMTAIDTETAIDAMTDVTIEETNAETTAIEPEIEIEAETGRGVVHHLDVATRQDERRTTIALRDHQDAIARQEEIVIVHQCLQSEAVTHRQLRDVEIALHQPSARD